jgi:hypothetical protein
MDATVSDAKIGDRREEGSAPAIGSGGYHISLGVARADASPRTMRIPACEA